MNRVGNPIVRLILRSALHRMFSGALLLIIYRGRRSGKEFALPVQYAQRGDLVYIVPGTPENKTWWRNLRGGGPVRLLLRGQSLSGQAEVWTGAKDQVLIATALSSYFARFPSAARLHHLQPAPDGTFKDSDLQETAVSLVMVCVQLEAQNSPSRKNDAR